MNRIKFTKESLLPAAGRTLLSVMMVALAASGMVAQTFNGSSLNTAGNSAIPSINTGGCGTDPQLTGGTVFQNTVAGTTGTLGSTISIANVTVNLVHTWDSDLDFYLESPSGQRLELSSGNGGSGDNYTNTVFTDAAPIFITDATAPFTGSFRPEGRQNAALCLPANAAAVGTFTFANTFTGSANGIWSLRFFDNTGGDGGSMNNWSITFDTPCGFASNPLPPVTVGLDAGACTSLPITVPATTGSCAGAVLSYSIGGGPFVNIPGGATTIDPDLGSGTYTITWMAMTPAGLIAKTTQQVTIIDNIPPVLVCPADIVVNLGGGECSTYVNYGAITATDNCPFLFQQQGFAGDYAPANWTVGLVNSNGGVNTSGAPATIVVNGSDNGSGAAGQTDYTITVPQTGTITFTWTYNTVDAAFFDPPGYSLNGVFTQVLAGFVTNGTGNVSLPVVAGDVFAFSQRTADNIAGPGNLTITNFAGPAGLLAPPISQTSGLPSGAEYPIGTTTNCFQTNDLAGNVATCCFDVTVLEYPNPTSTLVCNDHVQVSLSEDCVDTLNADQILEGGPYGCFLTRYNVNILSPTGGMLPGIINASHIGKTLTVKVTDIVTSNSCWGKIHVEDKLAPTIVCRDLTIPCTEDPNNPSDPGLLQPAPALVGPQSIIYENLNVLLGEAGAPTPDVHEFEFDFSFIPVGTPVLDVDARVELLDHTWHPDLDIIIESPNGTTVDVYQIGGCAGAPFTIDATFDDEGLGGITQCVDIDADGAPLQGFVLPGVQNNSILDAFDGLNAGGTWTLRYVDNVAGDFGTIAKAGIIVTVNLPAIPPADNCGSVNLTYVDNVVNGNCNGAAQSILRQWTATDNSGNSATCQQIITVERPSLDDVDAPGDIKWTCEQYNQFSNIIEPTPLHPFITDTDLATAIIDVNLNPGCDDDDISNQSSSQDHPGINSTNVANGGNGCPGSAITPFSNPGPNSGLDDADVLELTGSGIPLVDGLPLLSICGIGYEHEDLIVNVCPGTFKIVRTWTLIDWCANPVVVREATQLIKVVDEVAPQLKFVTQDTFHQVYTIGAAGPLVVNGANTTITVTQNTYSIGDTTQIFFLPNGSIDSWNVVEDVILVPPAVKLKLRSFKFVTQADINVYSASAPPGAPHGSCKGNFQIPPVVNMGDNCSGTVGHVTEVWTLNGVLLTSINGNGGVVSNIPLYQNGLAAQYRIRYYAVDGCGNQAFYEITVTLRDRVPPVAVCDEITEVSVINNGLNPGESCSKLYAQSLDDGSYDNCQPVYFLMAKMNDATATQSIFNRCYYKSRDFCCDDIGEQMVILLVLDADPTPFFTTLNSPALGCDGTPGLFLNQTFGLSPGQPNYNSCMVTVQVTDKLPPVRTFCPPDKRITCDWYADNLETQLQGLTGAEQCEFLIDAGFGEATFYDNCALNVTCNTSINLDQCLEGVITRTWTATDNAGNAATQNCTSRIFVDHVSDWVIEFPADITVNCTNTPPDFGEPEIFYETCELVAVSYHDQLFNVVPDACYKILRNWTVINWCVVGNNIDQEVVEQPENQLGLIFPLCDLDGDGDCDNRTFRDSWNSASKPGAAQATQTTNPDTDLDSDPWDGYITYQQVIKVVDNVDPVFVSCANADICILDNSCDADVRPAIPVVDDCSQKVTITAQIRINGVWQNAGTVIVENGQPNGQFTLFPNRAPGTYQIRYVATDNCNNQSDCESAVTVRDCKLPTPYCEDGLVVELMPQANPPMVAIWAVDFNAGSFDNCPGALKFSFSSNPADSGKVYTCDSIGLRQVRIYVTDAAGNQDFCITQVEIQANQNQCDDSLSVAAIAGNIATEGNSGIENVGISVNAANGGISLAATTSSAGNYNLASVPSGNDYTVTPLLDASPLNGVTTYDLVLISKHILGITALNSPYKIIAADANKSNTVTTFDLVEIRKLILFINNDYPNNTSWRFVKKGFVFPNPANPFQAMFPEVTNINNLSADQLAVDFVAVKIGDVNGSAVTSFGGGNEERNTVGDLVLNADDATIAEGETYTVEFKATDFNVSGYQFTLNFDRNALEFVEVVPGLANVSNFGLTMLDEGVLTTSWNSDETKQLAAGEVVFGLTFKAMRSGRMSDLITVNSRYTIAEAYDADNQLLNVALTFNGAEVAGGFELFQNTPNPFAAATVIGFYLPEATSATLTITDVQGKTVKVITSNYAKGYNQVNLKRSELNASGVIYYRLDTNSDSATKKMILVD